jgi:4Fe-4S ferredoxin
MAKQRSRSDLVRDPHRPGDKCRAEPGTYLPVVHQPSCEADNACVAACPYDVFEIRTIDGTDYTRLSIKNKLKVRVHGMKMAYTPRAEDCRACGLCVVACPKDAITLVKVPVTA